MAASRISLSLSLSFLSYFTPDQNISRFSLIHFLSGIQFSKSSSISAAGQQRGRYRIISSVGNTAALKMQKDAKQEKSVLLFRSKS